MIEYRNYDMDKIAEGICLLETDGGDFIRGYKHKNNLLHETSNFPISEKIISWVKI